MCNTVTPRERRELLRLSSDEIYTSNLLQPITR
ncbi:hypothetical protein EYF80_062339 [Liparis tanakae]|uniref:Uncharacterized protein n=1 Tax=Liparis tanakae TaxID=230148 RepID=A0A4Z2EF17_9TELE|nr:hypothetical protein EYF80_062339 [Liparis tanakae]